MPNDLRTQMNALAVQFAAGVLQAIRSARLEDILAEPTAPPSPTSPTTRRADAPSPSRRGPGRPPQGRASAAPAATGSKVAVAVNSIASYVEQHPGTTGEAARKALGMVRTTWSPAVAKAIAEKRIRREGERRGAKYWAA